MVDWKLCMVVCVCTLTLNANDLWTLITENGVVSLGGREENVPSISSLAENGRT